MALIVIATIKDARAILDLQKLAFQSQAVLYNDHTLPPLTQTVEEMERDFQTHVVLKAVVGGKIVGSVRGYLREATCTVCRLVVDPAFQNQGIGTRLMTEIERQFPLAKRYELHTGQKSERNIRLYEKLGYRIHQTKPVNDRLTLVFMEKVV